MARKYYRAATDNAQPALHGTTLPTHRPIANYYRQSTNEQVGNISTTIQTVDMPIYLQRLGWKSDDVRMIDMDEGVSGTTKIDEREGMRLLFQMITSNQVGAVACQDEDRLFRDVTQIQVNIFIEACRSHNVLVITPSMIYDFAHPSYGTFHARQFRFKCEMAADFIKTIILGKLHAARKNLMMNGRWSNAPVPVGFMVDMRRTLPGGVSNPYYRKFEVFEPYAEVVREYFNMFLANCGSVNETLRQIWKNGPYFPDPNICKPPDGYKFHFGIRKNEYGWCFGRKATLIQMLVNANYIGHWVVKDTVVKWNNHPAIVDEDTFYAAFNYLSSVELDGTSNRNFRPNRTLARPIEEEDRPEARPLCSGLMYGKVDGELKSVGTHWDGKDLHYFYVLYSNDAFATTLWHKKAGYVDKAIVNLLLKRLNSTFDFETWGTEMEAFAREHEQQQVLKRNQLKHLETVMNNLTTSLESISTPELISRVEQRYRDAKVEYQRLQNDLNTNASAVVSVEKMKALKITCARAIEHWDDMAVEEKREMIHVYVANIEVTQKPNETLEFIVKWGDTSTDTMEIGRVATTGIPWMPDEVELLMKLGKEGENKITIARAFPHRTVDSISKKYIKLTKSILPRGIQGESIRREETYEDYAIRIGLIGTPSMTSDIGS